MNDPKYKNLVTYKQADLIYVWTKEFTRKFLHPIKDSRLISQMDDAGRSGKRNIAEGAKRKGLKDYINFLTFSRASLEELLEDYLDIAREKKVEIWDKNDGRLRRLRRLRYEYTGQPSQSSPSPPSLPSDLTSSLNLLIDLCIQTSYLLDQQISSLERLFIEQGGYTENLAKRRRDYRGY